MANTLSRASTHAILPGMVPDHRPLASRLRSRIPCARRALRTLLVGALVLLVGAVAARLLWPEHPGLDIVPVENGTGAEGLPNLPADITYRSSAGIIAAWLLSRANRYLQELEEWDKSSTVGRRVTMRLHLALAVVALGLGGWAAAASVRRWSTVVSTTGGGVTEILLVALVPIALALAAAATALLNVLRPVSSTEPLILSRRERPAWWAAVLTPVLALAGTVAVGQEYSGSNDVFTASKAPAQDQPVVPTSFAPDPAWTLDVSSLQDIVAGAAGPVILSSDGVQGLDPDDGSVSWEFRTQVDPQCDDYGTEYESEPAVSSSPCLITSPDRRYVAVHLPGPGAFFDRLPEQRTVVLDTICGQVVLDRLNDRGDVHHQRLQLTDSAVLDGYDVYSLEDGSRLWTLPQAFSSSIDYSGTAGHSSFILAFAYRSNGLGQERSAAVSTAKLILAPQSDPSATRTIVNVLTPQFWRGLSNSGWAAVLTDGGAQAVSLDALAGVDDADTTRTDLGAAVALNRQASLASGLLVTVPPPPEDTQWEQQKDAHQSDATSPSMVAAVFDPATGDVTDAAHTPGLAAARVGITTHATGDAVENRLTIVAGDGGAGVSYPVDAATVHSASDSDTFNSQLYDLEQDRLFSSSLRQSGITALSTPGATLVVQTVDSSTSSNRVSNRVRLFAFPEDASETS